MNPEPKIKKETKVLEGDTKRFEQINNLFEESKQWTDNQRLRWRKNEDLHRNIILNSEIGGPRGGTKIKVNLSLAIVDSIMAIVTDYIPTFDVKPKGKNDTFFADRMQKRKSHVERDMKLKSHILDTVQNSLIFSNGILGIFPKMVKKGTESVYDNAITALPTSVYQWYPSPGAIGMDLNKGEARYHIFVRVKHKDEIKIKYGKDVQGEGFVDDIGTFNILGKDPEEEDVLKSQSVLLKEIYSIDTDIVKYPKGRFTIWCGSNILKDGAIDLPRIPYFELGNYKLKHRLFGMGEGESIKEQILCLDQVLSGLADNIRKTGNPVRKIVTQLWTKIKKNLGADVAGTDIEVNNPQDITWEHPPGIPSSTFEFLTLLLQLIDVVSGVHDVMEGRKPTGITAGVAIAALQEAAQARIRRRISKEIADFVIEIGEFIIELLQMFDEETISIREEIASQEENENESQYAWVDYDPKAKYTNTESLNAEKVEGEGEGRTMKDSKFDIEIVQGVRLPAGRLATEERAIEKFEKGIYGIEEVYDAIADPDKAEKVNNWYIRNGMLEFRQLAEERAKIEKQYKKLIFKALSAFANPEEEEWINTPEEYELMDIIGEFPRFMLEEDFMSLPVIFRERILVVFKKTLPMETEDAETV